MAIKPWNSLLFLLQLSMKVLSTKFLICRQATPIYVIRLTFSFYQSVIVFSLESFLLYSIRDNTVRIVQLLSCMVSESVHVHSIIKLAAYGIVWSYHISSVPPIWFNILQIILLSPICGKVCICYVYPLVAIIKIMGIQFVCSLSQWTFASRTWTKLIMPN